MSKMTAKEILSRLGELETEGKLSVELYATYEDYNYDTDEDFTEHIDAAEGVDAEYERLKQESKAAEDALKLHAGYNNSNLRDDVYYLLLDKYHITRYPNKAKAYINCLGLGRVDEVKQKGGTDQGSEWYTIKYFVDHDVYIKTEGYYSSYEGTEFNDGFGYEVKPVQVMKTIYNKV